MSLNQLEKIEYIEKKLLKIREIINLEDAYQICDTIIISIEDELLEDELLLEGIQSTAIHSNSGAIACKMSHIISVTLRLQKMKMMKSSHHILQYDM